MSLFAFCLSLQLQIYKIMLKLALITLGFVAFAMILLCVKLIFVSGGTFSSIHISGNPEMQKRGIHCVQSMDTMERRKKPLMK